jgi:regulatory protein
MKITEITKGKAKLWAVRLEDDSTLWLHSDLLYGAGLRTGDDLTEERIADLRQQAAEHRAYEYGLYLLEKRGYSYRELYDRLMTAPEAQETAVLQALEKLTRYGFVNDARYAEQLAAHYVEGKKYGLRRAAFEMKHRGLSQTDIDDALAAYDNAETISAMLLELLQKKYARYLTDPDDRKSTEKVTAALVRRGFTYQQIRYALEDYFALIGEA